MAAATVTGRQQNSVLGNLRYVGADSIAFAGPGDTWTVPGIKKIRAVELTPSNTTTSILQVSGNVVTMFSGTATTYYGGVIGL